MVLSRIFLLCLCIFRISSLGAQAWPFTTIEAQQVTEEGKADSAIQAFTKKIAAFSPDSSRSVTRLESLFALATLYYWTDEYEKAENLLQEVVRISAEIFKKNDPRIPRALHELGRNKLQLGKIDEADSLFTSVRQTWKEIYGLESNEYAEGCFALAVVRHRQLRFNESVALYLECKKIKERVFTKESLEYLTVGINLFGLYNDMGDYESAEETGIEYAAIRKKMDGDSSGGYALACQNLSSLYETIGDFKKALEMQELSYRIYTKIYPPESPYYMMTTFNMGLGYRLTGNYRKAEQLMMTGSKLCGKLFGFDSEIYGGAIQELATLYQLKKQYALSEQLHLKALSILNKAKGSQELRRGISSIPLAKLYMEMGKYAQAQRIYLKALGELQAYFDNGYFQTTEVLLQLATASRVTGKAVQAHKYYSEAFNNQSIAIKKMFRFTSEKEKQSFLNRQLILEKNYFSFIKDNRLAGGSSLAYDLILSRRNMILSSVQQLRFALENISDSAAREKANDWKSTRQQLAALQTLSKEERIGKDSILEEKSNRLEKELTKYYSGLSGSDSLSAVTWKGIREKLAEDEAAVEFISFNYANGKTFSDSVYYLALITKKGMEEPVLVKLFEESRLKRLLHYRGTSAGRQQLQMIYAASGNVAKGDNIYSLLWKPIESHLVGTKTIYFTPEGLLHKISFAALPVNESELLSDKYHLVQLGSTASVQKLISTKIREGVVSLMGGIQYEADSSALRNAVVKVKGDEIASRSVPGELLRDAPPVFNYLEGTLKEISAITTLAKDKGYTVNLASGINGTEEYFKSMNGKNSPAIIHIATHGFFFPDPKTSRHTNIGSSSLVFRQADNPLIRSGLALAGANNTWKGKAVKGIEDGILTAYEVSNMYLPNTRLVVLSACETGLGDIQGSEGVYGLQRAFKIAGGGQLIMSLWKVPDSETAEFMEAFYKQLFDNQTINDAFYSAQREMKNRYRNDPYKWAAWVLVQ